jgi:hypothetical protein
VQVKKMYFRNFSQYRPGSRLGQSHFSLRSAARGGGPPLCIGKQEVGTYIYSLLYTYTGLLGRLHYEVLQPLM